MASSLRTLLASSAEHTRSENASASWPAARYIVFPGSFALLDDLSSPMLSGVDRSKDGISRSSRGAHRYKGATTLTDSATQGCACDLVAVKYGLPCCIKDDHYGLDRVGTEWLKSDVWAEAVAEAKAGLSGDQWEERAKGNTDDAVRTSTPRRTTSRSPALSSCHKLSWKSSLRTGRKDSVERATRRLSPPLRRPGIYVFCL